jgi:nucleotide-binding universal stress UspA family protein
MYKKILLAYDGSVEGRAALVEGARLAQTCQAETVLLAVVDISAGLIIAEGTMAGTIEYQREAYAKILDEGVARLKELGFAAEPRLEFGEPAQQIAAVAKETGADLVVVGHRKQGTLARWWNGSVGASLLDQINCSLLIAQTQAEEAPAQSE